MTDEKLTPERAVRLLRAKNAELEAIVLHTATNPGLLDTVAHQWKLTADVALLFALLADFMDYMKEASISWPTGPGFAHPPPSWPLENQTEPRICLATRWSGSPVYEGTHKPHNFKYGPDNMYEGHCGGWPKTPWGPDHPDYDEMGG